MMEPQYKCLFCYGSGPFKHVEHPIPESLGNDDTVLPVGFVCDPCNQYFGNKIESVVLDSPPFNVERVAATIKTKKKKYAKFESPNLSLYSTGFWGQLVFKAEPNWFRTSLINSDGNGVLLFDPHPQKKSILPRFLLKMGLELLLLSTEEDPYNPGYNAARECARRGRHANLWEVAYGVYPSRSDTLIATREDEIGPIETRQIYQYEMGKMASGDQILMFIFINHCFACNLSRPSIAEYVSGFNAINNFDLSVIK